jgi:osmoprotectant transport system permease protein
VTAVGIWSVVLAASLSSSSSSPSPTASHRALRVASKSFTESVILGEIAVQVARSAGAEAQHRPGFGGTRLLWNALTSGAIDLYPEYTGTIAEELIPRTLEKGEPGLDARLEEALAARGIGLIGPLGFNNTYAIGMTARRSRELGLAKISDLRGHPSLRFGFSNEFMSRRDGWPALRARYQLPQVEVNGLDHDLAYRGLRAGELDATDLYATDPEIPLYDLVVLEDDRHGFPRYDAVFLYRLDCPPETGLAISAMARLRGGIDAGTMASLNARAKVEHVPEAEVAADFLRTSLGIIRPKLDRPGWLPSVFRHAAEHLALVAGSLLTAILVAVPLGVLSARWSRLGQLVLGAVGIVQTIPSLALLVFMIPLFGIGARPAIVALFLYSLLPIVRNTHAGLRGISPALREAAEALGLPPDEILRRIELPLASPMILAGIKSAAVINVGTATLGALIGAGGFGQPIFTGIRLDDVGLILQGAVPASLLALAVQGGFELVERIVVPRGLRLPRSS